MSTDDTKEPLSLTPPYSATVQGSSPHLESQATLEKDPEPTPAAADDVLAVTQEEGPEPVAADPLVEELASQVVASTEVCGEITEPRCPSFLLFC